MSMFLPEMLLLVAFLVALPRYAIFHLAGFFYSLWYYSTQIDHSQEYAYFLTATFFCIWVFMMIRLYRGRKHAG